MNSPAINIWPEYMPNTPTVGWPHVEDATFSAQAITGDTVTWVSSYDTRFQTSLITRYSEDTAILPRGVGNAYIKHLATLSWLSYNQVKKRISIVPHHPLKTYEQRIFKELERHKDEEFLPFMYDGISQRFGDQLYTVLKVPNYNNSAVVRQMNNKLFAKETRHTAGMTVAYEKIDLHQELKAACRNKLQTYVSYMLNTHERGVAIKTQMSFSGVGVVLVDTEWNIKAWDKQYTLQEFFEKNIRPNREIFETIFMEPALPIAEKNVGSVQLYIDETWHITPYMATQQKMHGAAHNGNTLRIENTDPTTTNRMKEMAVDYYQALQDAVLREGNRPYIGDAAIDLCFLPTDQISPDTLQQLWISQKRTKEHTIVGKDGSYILYILENNSRYGGATGVSKTQVYLQQHDMLPDWVHLEIENLYIPKLQIPLDTLQTAELQLQYENILIWTLGDQNLLYDPHTWTGVLTATVIWGNAWKTMVMYGEYTDTKTQNSIANRIKNVLSSR